MMRTISASLLVVMAALLTCPAAAFAQDDQPTRTTAAERDAEFKRLSKEASQHYASGEYAQAIEAFQKAYAIKPVSNILYNIGRIHEKQGHIDQAISYYEKFVVAPNVAHGPRQDALDRLETLREVKAMQEQQEQQKEASASHEDHEKAPAETVETQTQTTPPPAPAAAEPPDHTLAWIFFAIGGTTLVASGVFAILTMNQFDRFDTAKSLDERRSAASAGQTFGVVSDSFLATGVVTSVLGVVFWLTASSPESDATASLPTVRPVVGLGSLGLAMTF